MYEDMSGSMNIPDRANEEINLIIKNGSLTISTAESVISLTKTQTSLMHILLNHSKGIGDLGG